MEKWRRAWRLRVGPRVPLSNLRRFHKLLETNSSKLIQGRWFGEDGGGCAMSHFWAWGSKPRQISNQIGIAVYSIQDILNFFVQLRKFGKNEPVSFFEFMTWFDATPRDEMIRQLLPEVKRSIALRTKQHQPCPPPSEEVPTSSDLQESFEVVSIS